MTPTRRDLLKGSVALAVRSTLYSGGIGAAVSLTSCGGGGGSGSGIGSPQVTPSPTIAITSVSNAAPMALTPVSVQTTGLDTTTAFTVSLINSGGSQVSVTPIRAQSDGTVIIPIPLVIDAGSGQTTGLTANLQISQNGVTSNTMQIVISDLPSLADLGLSPGQLSQAFNTYQTLSLGANINTQEAIGMLPGSSPVLGNLLSNLQTQLLNIINARNVVDNIVANPAYSLSVGAANDGTAITFNQASVSLLDRILAQYLAALTNQSAVSLAMQSVARAKSRVRHLSVRPFIAEGPRSVLVKNEAVPPVLGSALNSVPTSSESLTRSSTLDVARPNGIGTFVTGLTTLGGAASVVSTGQTLVSQNSTATDKLLSVASLGASVITIGATIVAATAAAPEIAAGAIVVAAWSSLAGVAIGTAMVGHDIYNLGTSVSALTNDAPGSPAYALDYANAKAAGANLLADGASTVMNAVGIGAVESVLTGSVAPAAFSVLDQIVAPTATDVALGFGGLITTTANIYAQSQFEQDINSANANLGQAPSPTAPASNNGFAFVDGTVIITNSNGPTLSPLVGVDAGTAANSNLLECMADANGNYSLVVPLDSPDLTYSSTYLSAYDPVSATILSSTVVDLSALSTPNQSTTEPTMTGTCNDTDASNPDGDDPDCD